MHGRCPEEGRSSSAGPWGQEALGPTEGGCHPTPTRCVFSLKTRCSPALPCGVPALWPQAWALAGSPQLSHGHRRVALGVQVPASGQQLPAQLRSPGATVTRCPKSPPRRGAPPHPSTHAFIHQMPSCVPGPVLSFGMKERRGAAHAPMCVGGDLSAHEGMRILVQGPGASCSRPPLPLPPLIYVRRPPAGRQLCPQADSQQPPPWGRKGPSPARSEVTRRGPCSQRLLPPARPAGSCLFVRSSWLRRAPEGPLLGLGGPGWSLGSVGWGAGEGTGAASPSPDPPPPSCS